jgi:hypothetical protein
MLEVEQASVNFEANARLSEIRSQLGIAETTAADTAADTTTATTSPEEGQTATASGDTP